MAYAACAVAAVSIVGTAVSASSASEASSAAAGRAIQQNTYEGILQQKIKDMESKDIIKSANTQAAKIMENARYMRSAQAAQNAGGGVLVGEGSSQVMQDRTTELAMQDALAVLYNGAHGVTSNNVAGDFARQTADMRSASAAAQDSSNQNAIAINATTSILGSALGAYGKISSK